MFKRARIKRKMLIVALLLPVAAHAGEGALLDVKLGMNAMTTSQAAQLWEDVELYARFEAFLAACGKSSNIEKRLRAAAQDCVDAPSLQKVEDRFRALKAGHIRESHRLQCNTDFGKNYTTAIYKAVDEAVANVTRACKACFIC